MEAVQMIHGTSAHEPAQGIPQGDDERFDALLLRYSPALYRIAFRKLGNVEDAEDAVQDASIGLQKYAPVQRRRSVFNVAWQHCSELRKNATPATLKPLSRVARRLLRSRRTDFG